MNFKPSRVELWAFIAASIVLTGWYSYSNRVKDATPATDFFTVREINIPDFEQGDDPVMVYDRTIKRDFIGTFIVELRKAEKGVREPACANSVVRTYKIGEKPPETVTLKWFVDRECPLPEGQYVAEATWRIEAEGFPMKEYSAVSNVFRVLPKGAQAYVTPEQMEQLERAQILLDNPIPLVEGASPPQ